MVFTVSTGSPAGQSAMLLRFSSLNFRATSILGRQTVKVG
jgi:hypothetical protein